jgi:hypothetical protein
MTTTAPTTEKINLDAKQVLELNVSEGQKIDLTSCTAELQSISAGKDGSLVINFSNDSSVVVKNFADVAKMSEAPTLALANGQNVNLSQWVASVAAGEQSCTIDQASIDQLQAIAPAAGTVEKTPVETVKEQIAQDAGVILIAAPEKNQDLVVQLQPGQEYKFGFAMNEPTSVKDNGGQLVISFKNGGEIIIPNYGAVKDSGAQITLKDGAQLSASEFQEVLASATQLNQIEAAAGDGGGGAGGGGFGFGSTFSYTPFNSLDPIGEINPTALQYTAPDREPEEGLTPPPAPPSPNLDVADSIVYEDGSTGVNITATPNKISEQITITIGNIDPTWTVDTSVSGGTYDAGTGTWTVFMPPGVSFTGGPTFSPPADSDEDMPGLVVTSTVTDVLTGLTTTVTGNINITTDAVADTPNIAATNAEGDEDTAIPLDITTSVKDTDGSETITQVVISNVPAGATFNQGIDNGGGSWTFTPAELIGLTITPPHDYHGTFSLTVTTTAVETNLTDNEVTLLNNTATNTTTLNVKVNAVADQPDLNVKDAQVKEDGSVRLEFDAALNDIDGSEVLTMKVEGLSGWTVDTSEVGGTFNAVTGVWTLTLPVGTTTFASTAVNGLILKPPADSDVDLNDIKITATATETSNNSTASNAKTADVVVDAVIDPMTLTAADVSALEDTPASLVITTATGENDGSEVITKVVISGVPAGFSLSAGTDLGGGVYELTTAQLVNLKLNPPADFVGTVNLSVTSYAKEANLSGVEYDLTDNDAQLTKELTVTFKPGADAPDLTVANAYVKEDGKAFTDATKPQAIKITATLDDPTTETLTVSISGIPAGASVDTTTSGGTYNAGTGTWTLTLAQGQNFDGFGPKILGAANSDVDLTGLVVTATATGENDTSASSTANATVFVDAVIDAPVLNVANATANEDVPVLLSISTSVTDTDGSESITKVVISGLPVGFSLSAGTNLGGGVYELTTAQLTNLKLNTPNGWNGIVNLTVTSHASETTLSGLEFDLTDNDASVTKTLSINIKPVADKPELCVRDEKIKEDGQGQLNIEATLTDPSETLTVTVTGFTPGWVVDTSVSGGTYNAATGTWSVTLPAGQNFNGGPIIKPPANTDVDLSSLVVTATSTDTSGGSASINAGINVVVDAVIDVPTLTVSNGSGNEGSAIPLTIATATGENDGSEAITKVVISGVPTGFTLSAGTNLGGGAWQLTQAQLTNLKLNTPDGWSGTVNLSVASTSTEVNLSGGEYDYTDNTMTVTKSLSIKIKPVADKPELTVRDECIKEDGSGKLNIEATLTDPTEALTVTVTGFTPGWVVDTSVSGGTYNAATGTWSVTLPAGQNFNGGPIIKPPANTDVDLSNLVVTATSTTTSGVSASISDNIKVVVDAVIDAPTLSASAAQGVEDKPVALTIATAVTDTDGSEAITKVVISGVPSGFSLSAGTNLGGGAWQLTTAQLANLTLNPPKNWSGTVNLTVASTAKEVNLSGSEFDYTDNEMTVKKTLSINIKPVADKPTLCVEDECIKEDGSGKLNIEATLADPSEKLTITVTGFKDGWTVDTSASGGTYNAATKTWTITLATGQNFNGGPVIKPPANSDLDMNGLQVTATSTASNGSTASVGDTINVTVDAVIDTPTLKVENLASQYWHKDKSYSVPLKITTAVTDTDGSEQITKLIIKLNDPFTNQAGGFTTLDSMGVGLNKGTEISPGVWQINVTNGDTAAALNGLALTVPAGGTAFLPIHQNKVGGHSVTITVQSYAKEVNLGGNEYDYSDNQTSVTSNICFSFYITPLVLDLGGDGITLLSQDYGVMFDMTNDGILDNTSWIGSTDGFLVLDRNSDGVINNQSEMFGDSAVYDDGFANLAQHDTDGDGKITAADAVFTDLKVWTDINGDGLSQSNELFSLGDMDIASINLAATAGTGNILATSSFTRGDGTTSEIADVLFDVEAGSDADTFVLHATDNIDTIKNFSLAKGDVLDFSDVLTSFDPLTDSLHNFVKTVNDGGNTVVQIDETGTGQAFHTIAVLEGVNIDIDTLTNNGQLIA